MKRILAFILPLVLLLASCGGKGGISAETSLLHFASYFDAAESALSSSGLEWSRMDDRRGESARDRLGESARNSNSAIERSCSYELDGSTTLDVFFYNEDGVERREIFLWIDKDDKDIDKWFKLFDGVVQAVTGQEIEKDVYRCFEKLSDSSDGYYTVYPGGLFSHRSLSICDMSSIHTSWWEIKYHDTLYS